MVINRLTKISICAVLALLLGTGLFMLFASGLLASEPKVDTLPDNCYEETLRVITDDDYVPYSYYDRNGNMSGHDVELMVMLANEMHMNLDLAFEPWNDGISDAVAGKTDVLMTCDYSESFEGTDKLLMSQPITYDEFTVFSKEKISSTIDFKIDEDFSLRDQQESKKEKISLEGRKVLIVEDNELNREIAIDILVDEGVLVEEAENGQIALEMLKEKGPDYYDFILMDIQMPIMNGYEATVNIRKMYPDKHIPIIALSANAFTEDRTASLAAGMDEHVAKPIEIEDLFRALDKYIR